MMLSILPYFPATSDEFEQEKLFVARKISIHAVVGEHLHNLIDFGTIISRAYLSVDVTLQFLGRSATNNTNV